MDIEKHLDLLQQGFDATNPTKITLGSALDIICDGIYSKKATKSTGMVLFEGHGENSKLFKKYIDLTIIQRIGSIKQDLMTQISYSDALGISGDEKLDGLCIYSIPTNEGRTKTGSDVNLRFNPKTKISGGVMCGGVAFRATHGSSSKDTNSNFTINFYITNVKRVSHLPYLEIKDRASKILEQVVTQVTLPFDKNSIKKHRHDKITSYELGFSDPKMKLEAYYNNIGDGFWTYSILYTLPKTMPLRSVLEYTRGLDFGLTGNGHYMEGGNLKDRDGKIVDTPQVNYAKGTQVSATFSGITGHQMAEYLRRISSDHKW